MSKNNFEYIIEKYLIGTCNSNEKAMIEHWFASIGNPEALNDQSFKKYKEEIWQKINAKNQSKKYSFLKYAAVLLFFMGISYFIYRNINPINFTSTSEIVNSGASFKKITLSDGSRVYLAPYAVLKFPDTFQSTFRKVELSGKAFFRITKNPKQPFLVYSKTIITKVLGTSFWINPTENDTKVAVEVISGKVLVFEKSKDNTKPKSVVLTVNQKVTYFEKENKMEMGLISAPILIEQNNLDSFQFDESPLSSVLKKYEDKYGIQIIVKSEKILDLPLTANLNDVPFYTALEIICQSINAKYEVADTKIILSQLNH